jgi:hypothetical protein
LANLAGVLAFLTGADHLVGKQVVTIGILAIYIATFGSEIPS